MQEKFKVASFFAGAGGLDMGFHEAGFDIVYASDIDEDCCETLRLNKGISTTETSQIVCGDIRQIDLETLPGKIDLVVGGPPCQSFSASGRRAGGAAGRLDDRGNLFKAYCRIIQHLKPKAFVFENVRGIFATNKGQDWADIVEAFNSLGYNLDYRLLDAADYGIPQHRERVFLIGHKLKRPFLFPRPIYGPDSNKQVPYLSPRQAFSKLSVRKDEAEQLKFEGGKYSRLLPKVPEGQNYLFFTAKRGHPNPVFAYRSRFSDFLYKAHPDYPMKTIIASPGKYTGPLHWDNRYFSVPEYKAIQGFPPEYTFFGERASVIKQIGNSVSPKIANQLAQAVAHQVFGLPCKIELLNADESLTFDKRKSVKAAKTRSFHKKIEQKKNRGRIIANSAKQFEFDLSPHSRITKHPNVTGSSIDGLHKLAVRYSNDEKPSAKVILDVWSLARDFSGSPAASLEITLFGLGLGAPQLLWNAVDEWVRVVSSFGSLFELYGHFTEPYPFFKVTSFEILNSDPVLEFAKYVSDFSKCSKYLDKEDLMRDLAQSFGVIEFDDLANCLRSLRYDVRTRETNIAIPKGKYMIAYPFTLPRSKQMNFSIKKTNNFRVASSYITEKRVAV